MGQQTPDRFGQQLCGVLPGAATLHSHQHGTQETQVGWHLAAISGLGDAPKVAVLIEGLRNMDGMVVFSPKKYDDVKWISISSKTLVHVWDLRPSFMCFFHVFLRWNQHRESVGSVAFSSINHLDLKVPLNSKCWDPRTKPIDMDWFKVKSCKIYRQPRRRDMDLTIQHGRLPGNVRL